MADILDYHLQRHLRTLIRKAGDDVFKQLKNVLFCGQTISPTVGAVFLLADGQGHSKYHGHTHCQNPWCCPVCSAIVMEKYREKIALAIEVLHKNYFGFMVTFTIPHFRFMSWRETMDILYETHDYFRLKSFNKKSGHSYHEFNKLYPVEHSVKVCEFTWSRRNGAHPHFHAIWWIPRDKFNNDEILRWEEELGDFWVKTAKRKMIAYWKKHNLHYDILREGETLEDLADRVFLGVGMSKVTESQSALYISKHDGKITEVVSSDYIAGWGSDSELTGNYRREATCKSSMTPYQILQASEHDPKMAEEYMKFCLAVTQKPVHHRVRFSNSGITKMVNDYRKTLTEVKTERLEKKSTWEVVTYFDEDEWFLLCDLDDEYAPVLANILWFAAHRRDLLADYLQSLGLTIHEHKHRRQREVEQEFCA